MKNILNVKPDLDLNARLVFSNELVDIADLKNKRVLDIGCGFGWFELNALKKGVKEIAGIEISAEDLKAARSNIKDGRAVFKIGGALKLPFKDNYFDTVVAWEVVEHIPKNTEDKMFKEVYRVLKKKGTFYLSFSFESGIISVANLSQLRLIDSRRLAYPIGEMSETDFVRLKEKLKALLP